MKTLLLFSFFLMGSVLRAQDPLFTEVPPPVYENGNWVQFPALKDMRSAWGDFDADGDMDVVIMGRGPSGPVTKIYVNDPSSAAIPFAFEDRTPLGFPQLQDGALAWGDMDNDGDLDLAMTGSVRTDPVALPAAVQAALGTARPGFARCGTRASTREATFTKSRARTRTGSSSSFSSSPTATCSGTRSS